MVKYYKRLSVGSAFTTTSNQKIPFTPINNLVEYFSTDNSGLQAEFELAMRQQRGGITEISWEEFSRDYVEVKKKLTEMTSRPAWREEIVGTALRLASNPINKLGGEAVARAVGVETSDITAKRGPAPIGQSVVDGPVAGGNIAASATNTGEVKPQQEFKPKLAKRKQVKKSQ